MKSHFQVFFSKFPALFYGIALLLGIHLPYSIVPLALLLWLLPFSKKIGVCILALAAFSFMHLYYLFPDEPQVGTAHFVVKDIKKAPRKGWIYRGEIQEFVTEDGTCSGRHLPASLFSFAYETAPFFLVEGTLKPLHPPYFTLKTKKKWTPVEKPSLHLATKRFEAKKVVETYVSDNISSKKAAHFLSGLATGQLHNREILKNFERKGLLHLLAISGFHFAMLASCLHAFLRCFSRPKVEAMTLVLFLSAYFLFIGNAPSVQRAWISALVLLCGQLFERPTSSLNNLGVALLLALICEPLVAYNAGFQLSYLATCGILLLYKPLETVLPFRPAFLRGTLALCLAVHLALLPLLFSLFHKVPLS
jgi:competence protein ComEC